MTKFWHTWIEGYRACIKGVDRGANWYEIVRPDTKDSIQWYQGCDKADVDKKAP